MNVPFVMPPESLEAIARRAAELAVEMLDRRGPLSTSPYMSVAEGADFLRCSTKRIYDLRSSGRLTRITEGGRALVLRAELERLVIDEHVLPGEQQRRRVA